MTRWIGRPAVTVQWFIQPMAAQPGKFRGDQGAVYATKDGGNTWTQQITPTDEGLNGICFINDKEGWAVGNKGTVVHTTDGGVTWLAQEYPTKSNLTDITQSKDGTLWAVGEWGTILKY